MPFFAPNSNVVECSFVLHRHYSSIALCKERVNVQAAFKCFFNKKQPALV
ncbi:hypothetical protein HMPREF0476_1399 [Kingella kingae ATCC 23330]|uniref:Uncharacterized protein n=1 Tax=Kingella kingae ATCC 23330 TaxID=887327 RepID=F5S866_KINKI|nr:hypothetical protein HMPREF0476_1399 [Kingella kingae ATCC 23330]